MKLSTTVVAACAAFTLIAAGCGGDDSGSGADTTAAAVNDTEAPSVEAPDTETTDAPDTETTDATGDTETTEALVAETPGADPVYVDGQAPPERTITIVDGAFEPSDLTIAAGETVTFVTEEGIYGVIVGGLDGYTVTTGLYGTFQFDAPGTYPVREDISGNTATITVTG
jgi:plastocyanin